MKEQEKRKHAIIDPTETETVSKKTLQRQKNYLETQNKSIT